MELHNIIVDDNQAPKHTHTHKSQLSLSHVELACSPCECAVLLWEVQPLRSKNMLHGLIGDSWVCMCLCGPGTDRRPVQSVPNPCPAATGLAPAALGPQKGFYSHYISEQHKHPTFSIKCPF